MDSLQSVVATVGEYIWYVMFAVLIAAGLFLTARTRAVQVVPFDDHLAEGAEIDIELVSKPTRRALLELAAMVADDFAIAGGRHANQEQQ